MQKSVRPDREDQSTRALSPLRLAHGAPLLIGLGRRPVHGKGPKRMITRDVTGCGVEGCAIERAVESELVSAAKGSIGLVIGAYVIAITSGRCAVAWVKLGMHFRRCGHPDVPRQQRIQGPAKLRGFPSRRYNHANGLPARMNTRIRPTRPKGRNGRVTEAPERLFDHPLYRAQLRLPLPAAEVRAVILQNELHGAIGHRQESYRAAKVRARKMTVEQVIQSGAKDPRLIDFMSVRQTHCPLS